MKYAVLYQSNTGNTKKIAEAIFDEINTEEKVLVDIYDMSHLPKADVYFVGFAVCDHSCSLSVMEALDSLEDSKVALFATCGFYPVEKYKYIIEKNMQAWINEDVEYLGMYLCQGRVQHSQQVKFINGTSYAKDIIHEMFDKGESHPDEEDILSAKEFVRSVLA